MIQAHPNRGVAGDRSDHVAQAVVLVHIQGQGHVSALVGAVLDLIQM